MPAALDYLTQQLGHASIVLTANTYTTVLAAAQHKAAAAAARLTLTHRPQASARSCGVAGFDGDDSFEVEPAFVFAESAPRQEGAAGEFDVVDGAIAGVAVPVDVADRH